MIEGSKQQIQLPFPFCKGEPQGRYNAHMAPIKVRGRFASAYDTAKTLGVSPSRTRELINTAQALTSRVGAKESDQNGRRTSASRKSSRRNASNRKANPRRVKSGR